MSTNQLQPINWRSFLYWWSTCNICFVWIGFKKL